MAFYDSTRRVLQWFNAELSEHMDLFVQPTAGLYVLVEKYHCDILTTSRVYKSTGDGRETILPPNAWNSHIVHRRVNHRATTHYMNCSNMYSFTSFEDFVTYIKLIHATKNTIPFLRYKEELQKEQLLKLVDTDIKPPARKKIRREKIYIST